MHQLYKIMVLFYFRKRKLDQKCCEIQHNQIRFFLQKSSRLFLASEMLHTYLVLEYFNIFWTISKFLANIP